LLILGELRPPTTAFVFMDDDYLVIQMVLFLGDISHKIIQHDDEFSPMMCGIRVLYSRSAQSSESCH
jgi:hypothetical protein